MPYAEGQDHSTRQRLLRHMRLVGKRGRSSCSGAVVDGEAHDGGYVVAHEEREQLSEGEVEVVLGGGGGAAIVCGGSAGGGAEEALEPRGELGRADGAVLINET